MSSASTRACRCVPVHLLYNRSPTCRALVLVRTLALTNPGPPLSHAASPNVHKSATAALVPGMALIFPMHFIPELASDVSSCTKYRSCAACASYSSNRNSRWSLSFFLHHLFPSLSDPMMTSGSLLPMMCLISSRAGLSLKSQFVMSSAPADEIDTQFNELFSMFGTLTACSREPFGASCVVLPHDPAESSSLTSSSGRADRQRLIAHPLLPVVLSPLFVVILLLLSGPDGFKCSAPLSSALSSSVVSSSLVSSLLLGSSLSSHHSCRRPVQSLWWC